MKKVILAVSLVATLGASMISCNPDKARCWAVIYKGYVVNKEKIDEDKVMREEYFWGTMDEASAYASKIMFENNYVSNEVNDMAGLISQKNCHK